MLNPPSGSRHPKYPVPICHTRSPPFRWCDDTPPSPVLCRQPAISLPRFNASNGRPAQRPEAHPGHVDDRGWPEGASSAACAAHEFRARYSRLWIESGIAGMTRRQREGAVLDDQVVRLQLHLVVGAEAEVIVFALGRGVDPSPLVAAEWAL